MSSIERSRIQNMHNDYIQLNLSMHFQLCVEVYTLMAYWKETAMLVWSHNRTILSIIQLQNREIGLSYNEAVIRYVEYPYTTCSSRVRLKCHIEIRVRCLFGLITRQQHIAQRSKPGSRFILQQRNRSICTTFLYDLQFWSCTQRYAKIKLLKKTAMRSVSNKRSMSLIARQSFGIHIVGIYPIVFTCIV